MKIAIVGDPHISTGFRARVDEYLRTVLRKIEQIAEENDKVIFLGDLFDASSMSTYVFNTVYKLFKEYPNKLHTILGNHDMFHRNLSSLNRTTIGSLQLTDVLAIHTKEFELGGLTFVPVLTDTPADDIPYDDGTAILLGHKYFEMLVCPEESLEEEDIRRLNYKWVFLGHDHVPYEPKTIGNSVLYRPGSLTRTTTDLYNKDRAIRYYQIDTTDMTVTEKPVFCLPSDQVYLKGSFDKKDKPTYKVDSNSLTKLLAKFDRKSLKGMSLEETLKRCGGSAEEVQYIRELHRMHNISYN